MNELLERITLNAHRAGGKPCIRGLLIRVTDVLDLMANGFTTEQILEELPDLEANDIKAWITYASMKLSHAESH
jgi:uncharacterized protein (DUF433 family)